MEFNVIEHFKDYKRTTDGPVTPEAQGTSFFLGGPMGKRIREHAEPYADKAGVSRRMFFGTASGFAATMHAGDLVDGQQWPDPERQELDRSCDKDGVAWQR